MPVSMCKKNESCEGSKAMDWLRRCAIWVSLSG